MKRTILKYAPILFLALSFVACNSGVSLQKYYVEKQNNDNFLSIDLPASLISLNENASSETKEILSTLKKLNVLAFKINETNKDDFIAENKVVKQILSHKKYNELIRVKYQKAHVTVKYLGEEDAIDEVILFASDKDKGFALARVLGNNMRPEKIIQLLQNLDDIDKDNAAFSQIEGFLKDIK